VKPIVVIAAVLALAACGSSGPQLYSVQKAKACLAGNHVGLAKATDFVASTATGGAFRANVGGDWVTVVMGATVSDADNINQAYRRFHAKNVGIDDVLRQDRNAVLLWQLHPTDDQAAALGACLK
jgi:major membrane immunogen (membrane-anchored lipoprotein)